jgi:hypothetical protein
MTKTETVATEKYEICSGPGKDELMLALFHGHKISFLLNRDRKPTANACVQYTGIEVLSMKRKPFTDDDEWIDWSIRGTLYHDPNNRDANNTYDGTAIKCKFTCVYTPNGRVGEIRIMPQFPVR